MLGPSHRSSASHPRRSSLLEALANRQHLGRRSSLSALMPGLEGRLVLLPEDLAAPLAGAQASPLSDSSHQHSPLAQARLLERAHHLEHQLRALAAGVCLVRQLEEEQHPLEGSLLLLVACLGGHRLQQRLVLYLVHLRGHHSRLSLLQVSHCSVSRSPRQLRVLWPKQRWMVRARRELLGMTQMRRHGRLQHLSGEKYQTALHPHCIASKM